MRLDMTYFYDYYAKEYREQYSGRLIPAPAALLRDIDKDRIRICRNVLRNAFSGYREDRNREQLRRLLNEYQEYVSGTGEELAKTRYNAFVYRYMIDVPVGMKAIGSRLGITKDTAAGYVSRVIDELLQMCMGIPAAVGSPEDSAGTVRVLIKKNRILRGMAGDYVLSLFPGQRERMTIEQGRSLTAEVMRWLEDSTRAYCDYCNDVSAQIETDIRKAEVLQMCIAGVSCPDIAEKCGCDEGTVYSDIRENESRLAAMMFKAGGNAEKNERKARWK
jgi:DNA-binding CsgD family transcriptional regulator